MKRQETTLTPPDRGNRFLWCALALYVLLTCALAATVPIGAAPDENAHLEYVQHLVSQGAFPVFEAKGANNPGYEFHQPPLYYSVTAVLWKLTPDSIHPDAARFVSLLCGALVILLAWCALRLLLPKDVLVACLGVGLIALWPMHIGVGASAGNDAMAGVMCAGMFWVMARACTNARENTPLWRDAVLMGVFFGFGMLTKSSCLTVGIAGLGSLCYFGGARRGLAAGALGAAVTFLICGAWLMRNQSLYGDPLAARIFDEAFKNSSPSPGTLMASTGVDIFGYLRAYFVVLFATCWGFFGGPNTTIAVLNPFGHGMDPQYIPSVKAAIPLMLACFAGSAMGLWGFIRAWRTEGLEDVCFRKIALWWGVGLLLVCLALLRFNLGYFQAQARYLHPALLPMALILALGCKQCLGTGARLRVFAGVWAAVLIALTLWNAFGWKTLV